MEGNQAGKTRKRRHNPEGEAAKERTPSLKLTCPICAHNLLRYEFVTEGNCKSTAGFTGLQNVIQHLIQHHLHLCRRCKKKINHPDGEVVKTQTRYREALKAHGTCIESLWMDGEEERNPELLTEEQQKFVLEYSSREQRKLHGKVDEFEMWKLLYKALYPEDPNIPDPGEDKITPNIYPSNRLPDRTYYMPRHEHEAIMNDLADRIPACMYPMTVDIYPDNPTADPLPSSDPYLKGAPEGEIRDVGSRDALDPKLELEVNSILHNGLRKELSSKSLQQLSDSGYGSRSVNNQPIAGNGEESHDTIQAQAGDSSHRTSQDNNSAIERDHLYVDPRMLELSPGPLLAE
ncbi:hypothetical protein DL765_003344 [Monosporascus sp. GIB2]|nr:hypothetical protein DL765_003344 [Monosporascus sp. GIB2]